MRFRATDRIGVWAIMLALTLVLVEQAQARKSFCNVSLSKKGQRQFQDLPKTHEGQQRAHKIITDDLRFLARDPKRLYFQKMRRCGRNKGLGKNERSALQTFRKAGVDLQCYCNNNKNPKDQAELLDPMVTPSLRSIASEPRTTNSSGQPVLSVPVSVQGTTGAPVSPAKSAIPAGKPPAR